MVPESHWRSRRQLSLYEEAGLLGRLADQQQRLVVEVLSEAARADDASAENERLARDLAGTVDRIQEVHHRIRNHLQVVTGLLSAHEAGERSPQVRRALQKSVGRVASIAAIHDLLARDPASGLLRLPELAQQLGHHLLRHTSAEGRLRMRTEVVPLALDERQATAFVLILTELISNAIEHGFREQEDGDILVSVTHDGAQGALEVRDTGRGLPAGFDPARGDSLGLGLVSRLAERDLGGRVQARSDGGAVFRVEFPLSAAEASQ